MVKFLLSYKQIFIIILTVYWSVTLLFLFPFAKQEKKSSFLTSFFLAPDYRMYSKVPTGSVYVVYTYYLRGNEVLRLNSEDFLREKIRNSSGLSQTHKTQYILYFSRYLEFDSRYENWYYDLYNSDGNPKEKNYLFELRKSSEDYKFIENFKIFAQQIMMHDFPNLSYDSARMDLYKKPFVLEYDHRAEKRFDRWLGEVKVLQQTFTIKR